MKIDPVQSRGVFRNKVNLNIKKSPTAGTHVKK